MKSALKRLGADSPEAVWLVGVSGGLDSVTLLDLLRESGLEHLQVVHIHHGLRGEDADADMNLAMRVAQGHGLRFHCRWVQAKELAEEWECSVEEAGRRARHEFFAEVAAETGAHGVFVAHHADDQAETVLWNILRGAGLRGAGGIRERTEIMVEGKPLSVHLLRPLLEIPKAELLSYAKTRNLSWREDASNADARAATRNRLRLNLLPLIEEQLGRPVRQALTRFAELARQDEEFMAQLAEAEGLHKEETLDVARLGKLALPLQTRIIRAWLRETGCRKVGLAEVQSVLELLEIGENGQGKARVSLPGNAQVSRSQMRLAVQFSGGENPETAT